MKSYITNSLSILLTIILSFAAYITISLILILIVNRLPIGGWAVLADIFITAYGFCLWLAFLILRFRKNRTPRKENP